MINLFLKYKNNMKETMYTRLFKTDLKMLEVRGRDWNDWIIRFIERIKNYEVYTKEDWEKYQQIRDEFLEKVWAWVRWEND